MNLSYTMIKELVLSLGNIDTQLQQQKSVYTVTVVIRMIEVQGSKKQHVTVESLYHLLCASKTCVRPLQRKTISKTK